MPKYCAGRSNDEPCIFGKRGTKARRKQEERCAFCNRDFMNAQMLQGRLRGVLIRRFLEFAAEVKEKALEYVPDEYQAFFAAKDADWCCRGREECACVFAPTPTGGKAQTRKRRAQCDFCAPDSLVELCATDGGRRQVVAKMRKMAPAACQRALDERLPDDFAADIKEKGLDNAVPAAPKKPRAWGALVEAIERKCSRALGYTSVA